MNTAIDKLTPFKLPRKARSDEGLIALSDESENDEIWDKRRAWTDTMSQSLAAAGLEKLSVRLRDCANALFFWLRTNQETGEQGIKLKSAPFCHNRHCPICCWRRGLKTKAIMYAALPRILEQYPTSRWLFLTLTVRNPDIRDLRETIRHMNQSRKRLIERKDWPALGWICATEVTFGKDGNPHPHFHLLLQVPASYFSHGYVKTSEWVRRWREALRVDYDPVCDVRVIKPRQKDIEALQATQEPLPGQEPLDPRIEEMRGAIAEVTKYPVKAADLIDAGPEWLAEYIKQVHGLKMLTSGGTLKGILKDVREEGKQDLVHVGESAEGGSDDDPTLAYHWRVKHKKYLRKKSHL